jgi:hypothetical protein
MKMVSAAEITGVVAFVTGFLSGFGHCTGMCGPIVVTFSFGHPSQRLRNKIFIHLLYNTGRITTYTSTGALLALSVSFININPGQGPLAVQNIIGVVAGIFMIVIGAGLLFNIGWVSWLESKNKAILTIGRGIAGERSFWKYYLLGILFGLLPCGMSYSFMAGAAATGNMIRGMSIMLLFGLGTLPSMLLVGITTSLISLKLRGLLYRLAGLGVIIMGMVFLSRIFLS